MNSDRYDLFQPLPAEFDLAIMDRFAAYIPGWEMPKNSSEFLTSNYGFITATWQRRSTTSSSTQIATKKLRSAFALASRWRGVTKKESRRLSAPS